MRRRTSVTVTTTVTIERTVPHGTETDKYAAKGKCHPGDEIAEVESQMRGVMQSIRLTEEADA
jgi:hypothetical protein